MSFIEWLRVRSTKSRKKIVLARSSDSRVLKAANTLVDLDIGEVYLVRNANEDVLARIPAQATRIKG